MLKLPSLRSFAVAVAVVGAGFVADGATNTAKACSPSLYTGTVCLTAGSYCPKGFMPANGQILTITDHMALFSIIGNTYGGDGRLSFRLPDLRGRSAVSEGIGPGLEPVRAGERRGTPFNYQNGVNVLTSTVAGASVLRGKTTVVNNIPPQLGLRYCVAIDTVFPPRE